MATEEQIGVMFVEAQRYQIWVRSEPDNDGTWHNVLIFKRDGRVGSMEVLMTGVEWHVPPGQAAERAGELDDTERRALFERALRPRPPVS